MRPVRPGSSSTIIFSPAKASFQRRNPDEDFRRAFDRDPDEIRAVGLMADTDQLGARAEVWLREVRWESRGERRPSLLGPG